MNNWTISTADTLVSVSLLYERFHSSYNYTLNLSAPCGWYREILLILREFGRVLAISDRNKRLAVSSHRDERRGVVRTIFYGAEYQDFTNTIVQLIPRSTSGLIT